MHGGRGQGKMLPMYDQHLMDVFDILTGADYEVTGSRKVRGRDQNCDRNRNIVRKEPS